MFYCSLQMKKNWLHIFQCIIVFHPMGTNMQIALVSLMHELMTCKFVIYSQGKYSQKNWVEACGLLPKTLALFITKICNFHHPICDPAKNLMPYL